MIISIIVAMDKNRVIGKNNQLPWHMPADLKHFKSMTMGKPILMGRKTYDSIGKPLPGRRNVVITRQRNLELPGCEIFHSLENALQAFAEEKEVMIIGGAMLFEQSLSSANKMYITRIDATCDGDTFFPRWAASDWKIVAEEVHKADEKNPYAYQFVELIRCR